MSLHVLILADGFQRRLPTLIRPKALLYLPQCGETVLERTIRMVSELRPEAPILVQGNVLLADALLPKPAGYTRREGAWRRLRGLIQVGRPKAIEVLSFDRTPENVVQAMLRCVTFLEEDERCDRVVALLGDVVYSRDFLSQVLEMEGDMAFAMRGFVSGPEVIGLAFSPTALLPFYVNAGTSDVVVFAATLEGMYADSDPATLLFCRDWTRGIDTPFDLRVVLSELDHLARAEEIELQRAEMDRLSAPLPSTR